MNAIELQVRQWLERIVVGWNLCPFAGAPYRNGQIRFTVTQATSERELLDELQRELELLDTTPGTNIQTTLLIVAKMLSEFSDYNAFLDEVDVFLRRGGWEGEYQVATFHPQYRFEGTNPDDPGNLTNRSPWPILHILRESSLDQALADYPAPEAIPERNISKMNSLSPQEIRDHFPWLFNNH